MDSFLFLVVLTIVSGLFAMTEIALSTARKIRLENLAKKGNAGARAALNLANSPNKFLSATQIGITLVGIVMGMVGGEEFGEKFGAFFAQFAVIEPHSHLLGKVLSVFFVGFISIVFGEMIPKRIAMAKPEAIATLMAIPMQGVLRIVQPFVWLLSSTTDLFMRILKIKVDSSKVTEEEIKAIIDEGATAGTIEEIEQDIVERVFHLGDKRVGSLMTNRGDIVWLDANEPNEANFHKILVHNHAVYPVCEDELDNVLGIVTVKEILCALLRKESIEIRNFLKKVNYFPENMSAYGALEKFKDSKIHQGLVVDEYGTLVGIVTINDVFDALVGDISQDDGQIAYGMTEREDGTWLIDGQYPWDDFLNEFDIDDETHEREGFHTISGFILHVLEDLPREGQIVNWNNYAFEVIDMDGMRIDKIILKKTL